MLRKLWKDEAGTVGLEYMLVATIVSLALVVGLASLGHALNNELTELANAILKIDQTYSYAGYSTCIGSANGSFATDAPGVSTSGNLAATGGNATVIFCTGAQP